MYLQFTSWDGSFFAEVHSYRAFVVSSGNTIFLALESGEMVRRALSTPTVTRPPPLIASTFQVDPNYADEMDAFVYRSTPDILDYDGPSLHLQQSFRRRKLSKRGAFFNLYKQNIKVKQLLKLN